MMKNKNKNFDSCIFYPKYYTRSFSKGKEKEMKDMMIRKEEVKLLRFTIDNCAHTKHIESTKRENH